MQAFFSGSSALELGDIQCVYGGGINKVLIMERKLKILWFIYKNRPPGGRSSEAVEDAVKHHR